MNTTGKKGYWPIVQELRPGSNDGEEPQKVDMQYGATLEPVIEKSIDRNIQSYSNRNANINLQTYYTAEQVRILNIHILRFLTDLVNSPNELQLIIKVAQDEAWKNM